MSNLSEEEIINKLEWVIINKFYIDTHNECDYHNIHKAIQELLDLYNKEKEKNYNLTHVLFTGESDYISKDKINNLLKKYENEHFIAKVDLKSILEETNE